LADAAIVDLRVCGLSQNKAEYIKDISIKVASGELDLEKFRRSKSADSIVSELMKLRGMGRWTAEYVLIRGLTRTDVLPADDLAIRKSVSHYYFRDESTDAQAVRTLAEGWGKWKGLAAFYLMRARRFGIEVE
jgi:DNA-3-methyladenine glycosylase II